MEQVDPNALIAALTISVLTAAGTWAWGKLRGEKTENLAGTLAGLMRQEVATLIGLLVADPTLLPAARDRLNTAAWDGLGRLGIKRSKMAEPFVRTAVEAAMGEIVERVMTLQLGTIADIAADTVNLLKPQAKEPT